MVMYDSTVQASEHIARTYDSVACDAECPKDGNKPRDRGHTHIAYTYGQSPY